MSSRRSKRAGKRAKVVFTDGYHVSPTVETEDTDLRKRVARILTLHRNNPMPPSQACSLFVVKSTVLEHPAALTNTPEGGTFGLTLARIQAPEFWPGADANAGVFLVELHRGIVSYWGGKGFEDCSEFPAGIPQEWKPGEEEGDEEAGTA